MAVPMLTRTELVAAILEVEETDLSKKQVEDVLDCLAYVATEEISKGRRFRIPNVGTIDVRLRAAIRKGKEVRNPATGETFRHPGKPASTKIGFRALKPLTDALPSANVAKRVIDKAKAEAKPRGKRAGAAKGKGKRKSTSRKKK